MLLNAGCQTNQKEKKEKQQQQEEKKKKKTKTTTTTWILQEERIAKHGAQVRRGAAEGDGGRDGSF